LPISLQASLDANGTLTITALQALGDLAPLLKSAGVDQVPAAVPPNLSKLLKDSGVKVVHVRLVPGGLELELDNVKIFSLYLGTEETLVSLAKALDGLAGPPVGGIASSAIPLLNHLSIDAVVQIA